MGATTPTREQAFELLTEFNQNESHLKHALAVEAVMRHFARHSARTRGSGGSSGSYTTWTSSGSPPRTAEDRGDRGSAGGRRSTFAPR